VVKDVRDHCHEHARLILETSVAGRAPLREELEFARAAATRRVRQGIPLEGLLHAFRVGHRTVWEWMVDEAAQTPQGRAAAIVLASLVMEYIDISSTQVAEAYLKEDRRLLATADRERRDLLENLLAGRLPPPGEQPAATELDPDGDLLVIVAQPGETHADEPHALHHMADAIAAHAAPGPTEPLVVVRQRAVVGVISVTDRTRADPAAGLRAAAEVLLARYGVELHAGLSTVCPGFVGIPHAHEQAREALRLARPGRPVVALTELSPFECLVGSAGSATQRTILDKGRPLLDWDADGSAAETLLAYIAANRSLKGAAERLFVHPNTVRYRLKRIERTTGADTRSLEQLVDLLTVIRIAREARREGTVVARAHESAGAGP
jgi:hypothetical protein